MEHFRKYPRANFHDYRAGKYFVTVCTRDKMPYLGQIKDMKMQLSLAGEKLKFAIETINEHYPDVLIPQYVIMPNHFHAICCLTGEFDGYCKNDNAGALNRTARFAVYEGDNPNNIIHHGSRLGNVIGSIKAYAKREANRCCVPIEWQRSFHEHIIRNRGEINLISNYIENNIARWDSDCYYSM